jgi:hypothetical protein
MACDRTNCCVHRGEKYFIIIKGSSRKAGRSHGVFFDNDAETPEGYESETAARNAAEAMARTWPGATYTVVQAIGFAIVPKQEYSIWHRL